MEVVVLIFAFIVGADGCSPVLVWERGCTTPAGPPVPAMERLSPASLRDYIDQRTQFGRPPIVIFQIPGLQVEHIRLISGLERIVRASARHELIWCVRDPLAGIQMAAVKQQYSWHSYPLETAVKNGMALQIDLDIAGVPQSDLVDIFLELFSPGDPVIAFLIDLGWEEEFSLCPLGIPKGGYNDFIADPSYIVCVDIRNKQHEVVHLSYDITKSTIKIYDLEELRLTDKGKLCENCSYYEVEFVFRRTGGEVGDLEEIIFYSPETSRKRLLPYPKHSCGKNIPGRKYFFRAPQTSIVIATMHTSVKGWCHLPREKENFIKKENLKMSRKKKNVHQANLKRLKREDNMNLQNLYTKNLNYKRKGKANSKGKRGNGKSKVNDVSKIKEEAQSKSKEDENGIEIQGNIDDDGDTENLKEMVNKDQKFYNDAKKDTEDKDQRYDEDKTEKGSNDKVKRGSKGDVEANSEDEINAENKGGEESKKENQEYNKNEKREEAEDKEQKSDKDNEEKGAKSKQISKGTGKSNAANKENAREKAQGYDKENEDIKGTDDGQQDGTEQDVTGKYREDNIERGLEETQEELPLGADVTEAAKKEDNYEELEENVTAEDEKLKQETEETDEKNVQTTDEIGKTDKDKAYAAAQWLKEFLDKNLGRSKDDGTERTSMEKTETNDRNKELAAAEWIKEFLKDKQQERAKNEGKKDKQNDNKEFEAAKWINDYLDDKLEVLKGKGKYGTNSTASPGIKDKIKEYGAEKWLQQILDKYKEEFNDKPKEKKMDLMENIENEEDQMESREDTDDKSVDNVSTEGEEEDDDMDNEIEPGITDVNDKTQGNVTDIPEEGEDQKNETKTTKKGKKPIGVLPVVTQSTVVNVVEEMMTEETTTEEIRDEEEGSGIEGFKYGGNKTALQIKRLVLMTPGIGMCLAVTFGLVAILLWGFSMLAAVQGPQQFDTASTIPFHIENY